MLRGKSLLLAVGVVAIGTLFTATEVRANPTGVPVAQPVPLSCTTVNFRIDAILGPNGEFPIPVTCVNNPGLPDLSCADYGYNISSNTKNVDHTVIAVSADQDLDSTSPAAFVSAPGAGDKVTGFLKNARHEYTVRFNSSKTKSVQAHVFIVGPSSPRISSVLVRSGNNDDDGGGISQSCLIAGPGVAGDPFQPISLTQTVMAAGGKCVVELIFDNNGNLADIHTDTPGCEMGQGNVMINGEPLQNNTSPNGITFGDGTTTCYGPPVPSPARCVCTKKPCP